MNYVKKDQIIFFDCYKLDYMFYSNLKWCNAPSKNLRLFENFFYSIDHMFATGNFLLLKAK